MNNFKITLFILFVLIATISITYAAPANVNTNTNSNTSTNSNTVTNTESKHPVSPALGPTVIGSSDSCMGSTSAGAQVIGFGLSIGSTYKDIECNRRKNIIMLHNIGEKELVNALLCTDPIINAAIKAVGSAHQKSVCIKLDKELKKQKPTSVKSTKQKFNE